MNRSIDPNPQSRIRNRNPFLIFIIAVVALGAFGTGMSWLEHSAKDEELARKEIRLQPVARRPRESLSFGAFPDTDAAAQEGIRLRRL